MMNLEEALKDSGIAEAWYDGNLAIVVKQGGCYQLSIQRGTHPPYCTRDGLSIAQIEAEMNVVHMSYPVDWNPVELEG
jgi:hypothetical protein